DLDAEGRDVVDRGRAGPIERHAADGVPAAVAVEQVGPDLAAPGGRVITHAQGDVLGAGDVAGEVELGILAAGHIDDGAVAGTGRAEAGGGFHAELAVDDGGEAGVGIFGGQQQASVAALGEALRAANGRADEVKRAAVGGVDDGRVAAGGRGERERPAADVDDLPAVAGGLGAGQLQAADGDVGFELQRRE